MTHVFVASMFLLWLIIWMGCMGSAFVLFVSFLEGLKDEWEDATSCGLYLFSSILMLAVTGLVITMPFI